MIFHYNYPINISKLSLITKLKKLEILDFGCGIGNWFPHDVNLRKVKKIILYDNTEILNTKAHKCQLLQYEKYKQK